MAGFQVIIEVHAMIKCDDAPTLERELHRVFVRNQVNKVNPRKEFFRVPLQELRSTIESLGHSVRWTMKAECRQFRETRALEKRLSESSTETERWMEHQLLEDRELALSEEAEPAEA